MSQESPSGSAGAEKSFEEKVTEVIEMVRPALQGHGGDVQLVGVNDDKTVQVRLQGACQGCPGAAMTMKMGIERILKEKVPEVKEVVAVA
ncbi:NifU family protein [Anaerobaca lacustris]|jgi:Fe-S cluster biogenesis protein NfuA|uniref:NifU family protein n=1 Tax=Anaerobaca lacustris TaxID=3044600 RepID=A0AAW6TUC1_9BACT|nr:NifU family protein [Sedimentisphaerales bacterium M17dextr]